MMLLKGNLSEGMPMLPYWKSEEYGSRLLCDLTEDMRRAINTGVESRFGKKEDFQDSSATLYDIPHAWYARHLAMVVGHRVATYFIEHDQSDDDDFEDRLSESLDLIQHIQHLLNPLSSPHCSKGWAEHFQKSLSKFTDYNPKSWVWCHLDAYKGISEGPGSRHYWQTGILDVEVCFDYISKPWMECPELDFMLVDALAYQFALQNSETFVRSKRWYKRIRIVARLGVSLLAGGMATNNYGLGIGIPAGIGTWTMLKMLSWTGAIETPLLIDPAPSRDHEWRVAHVASINQMLNDPRISPEFVRQRLLSVANLGVMWPTALIALVERSARRNPVAWEFSFPFRSD
jgi:hypothetical protein